MLKKLLVDDILVGRGGCRRDKMHHGGKGEGTKTGFIMSTIHLTFFLMTKKIPIL